jgi:hypothetical protein
VNPLPFIFLSLLQAFARFPVGRSLKQRHLRGDQVNQNPNALGRWQATVRLGFRKDHIRLTRESKRKFHC